MYSFKKLKLNSDFRRIYGRGESFVNPAFVTYAFKNRRSHDKRIGITVSKKIGGAVQRNRAKRVLMAGFAASQHALPLGWDIVLVARTRILKTKSTELSGQMLSIFEGLGAGEKDA